MRVVIQKVREASVSIDRRLHSEIKAGLMILLGIEIGDDKEDVQWLTKKIAQLRIFNDKQDKMNLSVNDIKGECLVISQFTLLASTKKGNRPSYIRSEKPIRSEKLYEYFIQKLQERIDTRIQTGIFGADMKVKLLNDGPVTIIIDSRIRE